MDEVGTKTPLELKDPSLEPLGYGEDSAVSILRLL